MFRIAFVLIFWGSLTLADSTSKVWLEFDSDHETPEWQSRAVQESVSYFLENIPQLSRAESEEKADVKILGHLNGEQLFLESLSKESHRVISRAEIRLDKNQSLDRIRHEVFRLVKPVTQTEVRSPAPVNTWPPIVAIVVCGFLGLLFSRGFFENKSISSFQNKAKIYSGRWSVVAVFIAVVLGGVLMVRSSVKYHKVFEDRMTQMQKDFEHDQQLERERKNGTK